MNIAVLGGGSWGIAIARLLFENENKVSIWEYNKEYVEIINETRMNSELLPGIEINSDINVTNDFNEIFTAEIDAIVLAIPSQYIRKTLQDVSHYIDEEKDLKINRQSSKRFRTKYQSVFIICYHRRIAQMD